MLLLPASLINHDSLITTSSYLPGTASHRLWVMGDGARIILVLPDDELILDNETLDAALKSHTEAVTQPVAGQKRDAEEDISRPHHARKMRRWD